MPNLNFVALNDFQGEAYGLGKPLSGKEFTAFITEFEGQQVVNIYDGSAVVLTLTGPKIEVYDWYGWGAG